MSQHSDRLTRRWNAPPQWGYVKNNPREAQMINGRLLEGIEEGLTEETFHRVRLGYLCFQCKEPHEQPFPQQCSLCGFPMRAHQLRLLALFDRGEAKLGRDYGPSVNLDHEIDRLDAELEEDNWRDNPSRGISVPHSSGVR